MTAKDSIRNQVNTASMIVDSYLKDLSDADILLRPVPGMNHIAWQLGHLIAAERNFAEMVRPGSSPPLPEGFAEAHDRDQTTVDDPDRFLPLSRYQELGKAQRDATMAVLDDLPDAELDRDDLSFPEYMPTVGAILGMVGVHPLMHCGQFVAVRRALNKPIAM